MRRHQAQAGQRIGMFIEELGVSFNVGNDVGGG